MKLLEIRGRDLNRVLLASQRFKNPIAGMHIVEMVLLVPFNYDSLCDRKYLISGWPCAKKWPVQPK
jgi:hypothetical protein